MKPFRYSRSKEQKMVGGISSDPIPSWSRWELWAGILPFLLSGMDLIISEIPHDWDAPAWLRPVHGFLFMTFMFLPAAGLCIGWIRGFPRWSYSYLLPAVVFAWYLENTATPGFRLFGAPLFGRELWGWRAWVPLLVAMIIALLVTRSIRTLGKLFGNIWRDWTLATFAMFGLLPLLIAISFDEIDRRYSLYFMILLAAVLVAAATTYLRASYLWQQTAALATGVILVIWVTAVATGVYWLRHGWINLPGTVTLSIIITAVILAPLALEWLLHSPGKTIAA